MAYSADSLVSVVDPLTPLFWQTMTSSTLQQFELQLEAFEFACNHNATLVELMSRLREAISVVTPVSRLNAGVVSGARLIHLGVPLTDTDCDELVAACASAVARPQPDSAYYCDGRVLFTKALSSDHRLVIQFCTEGDPRENVLFTDAARTLTDCFAVAVNRDLASKLYERLKDRELADPLLRELHAARTFAQCAQVIADISSGLLSNGRVSVLASDADRLEVVAATGVRSIDRTADAIRQIETFADEAVQAEKTGQWIEVSSTDPAAKLATHLAWFAMNGVRAVRVEQLRQGSSEDSAARRVYVMIEIFEGQNLPSDNRFEFLMEYAGTAIHRLSYTDSSKVFFGWIGTRRKRICLSAVLMVLFLTLFPKDFEVEVRGQVFPVERHRVFAPDDGIVDRLAVNADDNVVSGQFLLQLRNAERILEKSRLLGEVDATISRLQAIRAARSAHGTSTPNQNNRSLDLSSEEQQLEQKLTSLREEQELVDQHLESLALVSPITGTVYQRRLKEQLDARPVQRGQLLMEIVNSTKNWQLELQIPENMIGYVRQSTGVQNDANPDDVESASRRSHAGSAVRFWLSSQPSRSFETVIESVEQSAHIEDQRLTCLVTALCRGIDTKQLRPGQSVTARIYCGRRSIGFVLFREVIEYLQKKRFAWL